MLTVGSTLQPAEPVFDYKCLHCEPIVGLRSVRINRADGPRVWRGGDEANLIKLHRFSGKVSYLAYPDFEADPHPALSTCIKLNMRSRHIDFYDYREAGNPPVLHRKETFLAPTHALFAKFARLTRQEERHKLLDDASTIGTRAGWQTRLAESGFRLAGHRLLRVRQAFQPDSNVPLV